MMIEQADDAPEYEPSEKYEGIEYVYLPLDNEFAAPLKDLHQAKNLPMDSDTLDRPEEIFCYFARIIDKQGHRLLGLRRST